MYVCVYIACKLPQEDVVVSLEVVVVEGAVVREAVVLLGNGYRSN